MGCGPVFELLSLLSPLNDDNEGGLEKRGACHTSLWQHCAIGDGARYSGGGGNRRTLSAASIG